MSNSTKNLYSVKNSHGDHLTYQVAESEKEAVRLAKTYYGFKSAKEASFVREN